MIGESSREEFIEYICQQPGGHLIDPEAIRTEKVDRWAVVEFYRHGRQQQFGFRVEMMRKAFVCSEIASNVFVVFTTQTGVNFLHWWTDSEGGELWCEDAGTLPEGADLDFADSLINRVRSKWIDGVDHIDEVAEYVGELVAA